MPVDVRKTECDAGGVSPLVSAVIIAYNEERNLPRCLASLRLGDLVDEVIVVDSGSTDATVALAVAAGARVLHHPFEGHIEQKNWAQAQAHGTWILSLDADEALSDALQASLRAWRAEAEAPALPVAYAVNRLTNYCGHWVRHAGWYPDRKVRLWRAGRAEWKGVNPHDRLEADGRVEPLAGDLLHYSYYTRQDHLDQIAYFSDIASTEAALLPLPVLFAKVAFQWVKTWLLRGGWRDGRAGWEIARWSAFATWEKYRKARDRGRAVRRLPTGRVERLLVVRTDGLGDVVVTLALAGWLKRNAPGLEVWMCVAGYAEAVARACPDVDRVVVKGAPGWAEEAGGCAVAVFAFPDREVVAALRGRVPVRVGTGRRWHMVGAMTHRVWDSRKRSGHHEAWHGLRLLEPVRLLPGCALPGRRLPEDEPALLEPLVRLRVPDGVAAPPGVLAPAPGPTVVVHPGSHGSAHNWSWSRYAALVEALAPRYHVVVTGTASEGKELAAFWERLKGVPVVDATGTCTVEELLAVLAAADCVVAASTGPLHMAAALGTRVVGLYGTEAPVWPQRWRPIGPRVTVLSTDRLADDGGLDLDAAQVQSAAESE